jgi:hypothetical protein
MNILNFFLAWYDYDAQIAEEGNQVITPDFWFWCF